MATNTPADRRAAALAAIEARSRPPPPSYDDLHSEPTDQVEPSTSSPLPLPLLIPNPTQGQGISPSSSASSASRGTPIRSNPIAQAAQARISASSSASPTPTLSQWRPTEKEDREIRIKFSRLLDRGIVRDNNYNSSAEAVETLLKIATNISTSNDPKFRTLKASNSTIKNKILDVKGGHDYLIALGFRTQTVDFTLHYIFSASIKKMHELNIGAEVLKEHLKSLQERVELSKQSKIYGASVEAARKAAALADIEADRDAVRARAARERMGREAREAKEREEREKEAQAQAELLVDRDDENAREMRDAVVRPDQAASSSRTEVQGEEEEEEEEEEEDRELPSYAEDRESRGWGGPGRRLGG